MAPSFFCKKSTELYKSTFAHFCNICTSMKRVALILLSVFYLGLSSGFTMHFHYCMGQLVKWGVAEQKQERCGYCGKAKQAKKSCCKDDYKQAKVDQSQKVSPFNYQFEQTAVLVKDIHLFGSNTPIVMPEMGKFSLINAPPDRTSIPVFIRNCTYRI